MLFLFPVKDVRRSAQRLLLCYSLGGGTLRRRAGYALGFATHF